MTQDGKKILAFSHIEKCGGTTLLELLRTSLRLQHCDLILDNKISNETQISDLKTAFRCYPFMKSLSSHALKPHLDYGRYNDRLRFYTILRDPIDRCISDFHHDFYRRGFDGTISNWLKYEIKHNYITKFIAGENNLDLAKEILVNRFDLIGIMESYDEFISALRVMFEPTIISSQFDIVNQSGNLSKFTISKKPRNPKKVIFDKNIYDEIKAKNQNDILLYNFAKTISTQKIKTITAEYCSNARHREISSYVKKQNRMITMLYRNLIYKPICREIPFSRYSLHQNKYNIEHFNEPKEF